MEKPEDDRQAPPEGKLSWEHPTIRLAGTISLLVRGGSAMGKPGGQMDGDLGQFLSKGQQ